VDPLPGLDEVAWASLHGTYRSAEDVPAQIEALRSPDDAVRNGALDGTSASGRGTTATCRSTRRPPSPSQGLRS